MASLRDIEVLRAFFNASLVMKHTIQDMVEFYYQATDEDEKAAILSTIEEGLFPTPGDVIELVRAGDLVEPPKPGEKT